MQTIVSRNPATGETLREIPATPAEDLPKIFEQAKSAQILWASLPLKRRAQMLLQLREALINQVDSIAETLTLENGKPRFEAITAELLPCVMMLGFFAKTAPKVLRNQRIPMSWMKHRSSILNFWPVGTVGVISPWNYPFLLPFATISMATASGNAVIFKPSEVTPLVGLKIQQLFDDAGFPKHLVQTIIGDGTLGAAMIEQKPNKIFFTGSVSTGKKVMAAAARHLIPVNLELGGKDPMIVLPDADLDFATSAALWGGFSNSGQVCASVERILVHESIAKPFTELLKLKALKLRQGNSAAGNNDLGAITFDRQKDLYQQQLTQARDKGAEFVLGGDFSADRRFLQPTIVTGSNIETLDIYNEETFGPVVAITTFRSVAEAIEKANKSNYGLLASVITRDLKMGESVAKQLEVGTVTINEVVYTAGLGETPWGGVKDSGFGRTHSAEGFREFVNTRHIHRPKSRLFVFKSPWWFPYTPLQTQMFRQAFELFRRHPTDRIRAFPHFLMSVVRFIKEERRL